MRNLPKGVWANFSTTCHICKGEIVVKDSRPERHECRERIDLDKPTTLADIDAALDNR